MLNIMNVIGEYNQAAYDHQRNWNTTAQPIEGLRESEYIDLARAAEDAYKKIISEFLDTHSFRYFWITSENFESYEKSDILFHKWLEDYKKEHKVSGKFDLCIVGPGVKSEESSERKSGQKIKSPDRGRDYLRCMPVILKQTSNKKNVRSIGILEKLIDCFEQDSRTLARKNYFYEPHKHTGMRAYKSLWEVLIPEDDPNGLGGFSILAECKVEHESQMDIDKLTRHFLHFTRQTHNALTSLVYRCASQYVPDSWPRLFKTSTNLQKDQDMMQRWGQMLYDFNGANKGFDQFLGPHVTRPDAITLEDIERTIMNDLQHINQSLHLTLLGRLRASGLFSSGQSRYLRPRSS